MSGKRTFPFVVNTSGWGNVLHRPHGAANGYVAVEPGSITHGLHFSELPSSPAMSRKIDFCSSFRDLFKRMPISDLIPVLDPSGCEDISDWWVFGFDTFHDGDTPDYWNLDAVKREVLRLDGFLLRLECSPDYWPEGKEARRMALKNYWLNRIGGLYKAYKSAKDHESEYRLKKRYERLLRNYLTLFFINLGADGKASELIEKPLSVMEIPLTSESIEYIRMAQFGSFLFDIRKYDVPEERLNEFRRDIYELKL